MVYIFAPGLRRFYLYLVPVFIGALAKSPAVMFAPLLILWMLLIEQQLSFSEVVSGKSWPKVKPVARKSVPLLIFAAAVFVFAEKMNPPTINYGGVGRGQYLLTQTWIWLRYIQIFFIPIGLSGDTDLKPLTSFDWRALTGLVVFLASIIGAWQASSSREMRPVSFGILWFWIALLPASSIFPLAEVTNDHRAFFGYIGLTAAVVWSIALLLQRQSLRSERWRRAAPVIAGALTIAALAGHTIATHNRNKVWQTNETFWASVVRSSPHNGRGLMNYGLARMSNGDLVEARDYFRRALVFAPNYPSLHVNLGIVSDALGDSLNAESWYTRALALDTGFVLGHVYYARYLLHHAHGPEAIPQLETALRQSAGELDARHLLMELYAARGDTVKLSRLIAETRIIMPTDPVAQRYSATRNSVPGRTSAQWAAAGLAAINSGRYADAAFDYRIALELDSANADAWNNLGWSLGKLGFFAEAVQPLQNAVRLRSDYPLARNNLAWVLAGIPGEQFRHAFMLQNAGKNAEAIEIYRKLLAANPSWANAHFNLAYALMTSGNCQDAIPEFQRTLELKRDFSAAHLHLATCFAKLGLAADAAKEASLYKSPTR
jgi:tetratricopeptide (TPR) repeat protein